jgi:hypothetical protein
MLSPTLDRTPIRSAGVIFGESHLAIADYVKSRVGVV